MAMNLCADRCRGFSLLEVMIVLVILGIATAAVVVSAAPDTAQALRRDARELSLRFSAAQAEARRDGRIIDWKPTVQAEGFSRRRWQQSGPDGWPALEIGEGSEQFPASSVLASRPWHSAHPIVRGSLPIQFTAEPLGQAWEIELSSQDRRVQIRRDADGQFRVLP